MASKMLIRNLCLQSVFAVLLNQVLGSVLSSRFSSPQRRHSNSKSLETPSENFQYVVEQLEPTYPTNYHSRRVKVSYPVVEVPPMTENDGMADFGDLATFLPCNECLILEMSSDIEYEDHSQADPNTGMWLHHTVFVNRGRKDTFCGEQSWGQRFYASGNEKTTVDMSAHG